MGYFSGPNDPVFRAVCGTLVGAFFGGIIGGFIPFLVFVGFVALVIWIVKQLH